MSPRSTTLPPRPAASALAAAIALRFGAAVRDERTRRRWTARHLAVRARVSTATVTNVEAGRPASLDVWSRLAVALDLSLEVLMGRQRSEMGRQRSAASRRSRDLVHSAMAELEAEVLARDGVSVSVDHPYQHFHFAGRADVLAWTREPPAMLHIENRTRFPDVQEVAGSFNAKCRFLAGELALEIGIRGFDSQTHVMVGLWSAEVIHAVRLRRATFRALCPDDDARATSWLAGEPPRSGTSRSFVLLDTFARGRQRRWADLEHAIERARPRVTGYRDAATRLDRLAARGDRGAAARIEHRSARHHRDG